MSIQSAVRTAISGAAITLVATLVSIYIVSQFLRNSIGVIAPNLAADLGLSPAEIGLLSSIFFLTFAAVQIPLGMALDRFGPRICLVVGAAITVIGAVVFACAANPGVLIFGRALLGLGTAGSFVASLAVYARRFPPDRFATLAGLQVGIGTLGALLATAPLAFSTATVGWRGSFLGVAAVTLLIGLMIAVVVKDDAVSARSRETLRESLSGIVAVLRTPSVGRLFVMNLTAYSTFGLIVGLWGGQRGSFLLIPVLTPIVGSMLWGPLDRLTGSHKLPVLVGAGATAAMLGYLALMGTLTPFMLVAWFAAFGFLSAYVPVLVAHGKALFSPHQVGRGLTVLNMGTMGGTFLAQVISGFVIGMFPTGPDGAYELAAYRLVFALQAVLQVGFILLTTLVYFGSRDPMTDRAAGAETYASCIAGRQPCPQKGKHRLLFPLLFVHCGVCFCGAVAPGVTAALLGRFLPRLGPLAVASGPFFSSIVNGCLLGRRPVGPQFLDREGGKAIRERLEVGSQTREGRRALETPLVHVKRAVKFELDGVQAGGRVAVMLGDEASGIWLVAADRVALRPQRRFDRLRHCRHATRAIAVTQHHVGARALVLGTGA